MTRKATSKPGSCTSQSIATIGFEAKLWLAADKLHNRADYVVANPLFNDSDWHRKDDDVRWRFGVPPKGTATFAWVQHFIHHLASHGTAGFALANGSMSSNQSGEGDIRRANRPVHFFKN